MSTALFSVATAVTVNGGTLGGSGSSRGMVVNSSTTISPGDGGAGILNSVGDVTLSLGAIFLVDLNGTAVGIQYDQLNVVGAVGINGATLSLNIAGLLTVEEHFIIVNNDGTDAVTGTFHGLAEGATFNAASQTFAISYRGGDGNDVVVTTVVPEPATWLLLVAGIIVVGDSLRRRTTPARGGSPAEAASPAGSPRAPRRRANTMRVVGREQEGEQAGGLVDVSRW